MLAKSINAKMGSKEAAGKLNTLTVFNFWNLPECTLNTNRWGFNVGFGSSMLVSAITQNSDEGFFW
jgi:hypothetical protein